MKIDTGVFSRVGQDSISERSFFTALAFFVIWGLVATAVAAHQAIQIGFEPGLVSYLLLGLGVPILGIVIALGSDDWPLSFLGYNMVAIPFGIILAPVLKEYNPTIIRDVCAQTAVVTGIMGFAGMSFPRVFRNLGGVLFVALCGLVVIMIAQLFVPSWQGATWVHWAAVAVFSLYIGFDFYRATVVPKTIDSAVDIAVSVYLDIINLFIHLLALSKKD